MLVCIPSSSVSVLSNCFSYVGYVPPSNGHYIENTGNTTLQFLELFNAGMSIPLLALAVSFSLCYFRPDKVEDISLSQWIALTPAALVKAHLGLDDDTIASLNKTKQVVVAPSFPS